MECRRRTLVLALILIAALLAVVTAPFIGIRSIPLAALGDPEAFPVEHRIFWQLRLPRVWAAFLAGWGLAVSGMCFQALFRNPLATPFTLGVASGASLGVALYVRLGLTFALVGVSGISLFAFGGAVLAVLVVYSLTRLRGGCSTATMLLAGVAVSFFFSSLILLLQYLSDFTDSFRIIRWLMGGIDLAGTRPVVVLLGFVALGSLIVLFHLNDLNLLAVGEEFAASRGVEVNRTKISLFFGVSLMMGGVVAVCGPIGFVGMICPHICRLLVGANHRWLGPASLLFGGAFLTLCDAVARTLVAPAEIPVGVITSLLGGPFFLWLLFSGRHDGAGDP